jgi:hypothetical protein
LACDRKFQDVIVGLIALLFASSWRAKMRRRRLIGATIVTHRLVFSYSLSGRPALSHNGILYIQGVGPVAAINVK